MIFVKLPRIVCLQCGWDFIPRTEEVHKCPHCFSFDFDKPKKPELICSNCGASYTQKIRDNIPKRCPKCYKPGTLLIKQSNEERKVV